MKSFSFSDLKSLFYECIGVKTPLTKNVFDKILLNWTNAYFQLFTMVYQKENN
jgi:hypothetical protein